MAEKNARQSHDATPSPAPRGQTSRRMRVSVCPTTGGRMDLAVSHKETVNGLKWLVSRNLRIPPEKITLLYKNRQLHCGSLQNNQVTDGSRITLLPNMESGLSVQKAEVGVIQALENLSDSQVNDFLSGKAPLLLAMRLGDHMMFVQLQLSTAPCMSRRPQGLPVPTTGSFLAPPSPSSTPPPAPPLTSQTVVNSTVTGTSSQGPPLSPNSLSRASRNLSQKLKELSKITSVNPKCSSADSPSSATDKDSGAVIESMRHHGKGVYSGTFSGTLDPTLQDQDGKPKRDLSTIIHILNDLLGANPPLQHQNPPPKGAGHPNPACKRLAPRHPYSNHSTGKLPQSPMKKSTDNEDIALRGKLERLQQMMEARRIRRRARRDLKSPYQWPAALRLANQLDNSGEQMATSLQHGTTGNVHPDAMKSMSESVVGEKITENSSYASTSTPMEHETLAV